MKYLLDTHTCIWAIAEQNKLSTKVKNLLQNSENLFFVSKISLLEIAIKLKIGKLTDFNISLPEFIQSVYSSGYEMMPFNDDHIVAYSSFDFNESHRDPFDRYLLAAAHHENMGIITKDEKFFQYSNIVQIIW